MKKKMLLISNMYPDNKFPSYGIFVKNFNDLLNHKGISIKKVVLTKKNNNLMKYSGYIFFYIKIYFYSLFKEYDYIYVHYPSHAALPLLLVKKIKNIKLYLNVHGTDVLPIRDQQKKFQKNLSKLMMCSDTIVVPSHYYAEVIKQKYVVSESKIFVSPSGGVSKKIFYLQNDKKKIKKQLSIFENDFIVGYVGRIEEGKGWEIFIEALNILINIEKSQFIKAIVVGNGRHVQEFQNLINKYNLEDNVFYYNTVSQDKLCEYYNAMDVFCFPSIQESLGLVGIEAMMCGVPVIGSDIPALREYIVEGVTGTVFVKNNPWSLAEKINLFKNEFNSYSERKLYFQSNCINKALEYESEDITSKLYNKLNNK